MGPPVQSRLGKRIDASCESSRMVCDSKEEGKLLSVATLVRLPNILFSKRFKIEKTMLDSRPSILIKYA